MSQVVCGSAFQWRVTCLWALCQNPNAPSPGGSESRRALSPPAGVESPRGGALCRCRSAWRPWVPMDSACPAVFFPLRPRTVPQWPPHRCSWSVPEPLQSQFLDRAGQLRALLQDCPPNAVSSLLALISCSALWLVRTLRQSHHEFVPTLLFSPNGALCKMPLQSR